MLNDRISGRLVMAVVQRQRETTTEEKAGSPEEHFRVDEVVSEHDTYGSGEDILLQRPQSVEPTS